MNFGGIDSGNASFEKARFVVIPVPYDMTSTYVTGSRKGPAAILDASCNMELYDEELRKETFRAGIHTTDPLEADARGPEYMIEKVRLEVLRIVESGKVPVMLGGEHSISLGAVQAAREIYPSLSVLQLDAHADLRDTYEGSPFSHACVARRISEICPLVQVGVRSMSADEAVFMEKSDIITITPRDVSENGRWIKKVCDNLSNDVYVSVDLDAFDPSIMPATGTPEPGGVYWKDVVRLIREVADNCKIRGIDVVELCPIPGMVAPDFTAAKLAYRIMGYIE